MEPKLFDPGAPVVLGLAGKALTGKTATATALAPPAQINLGTARRWTHLSFALPIYRMATARQKITGQAAFDRLRYELHETLVELFGRSPLYGAPAYQELVELVETIATLDCAPHGKPRRFLQVVGTELCRKHDPECFVNWMRFKILELDAAARAEDSSLAVVISDVRFANEARFITEHPNGVLVCFTASEAVRQQRSVERDGRVLTADELEHASEAGFADVDPRTYVTLDTTAMSLDDQVAATRDLVDALLLERISHAPPQS